MSDVIAGVGFLAMVANVGFLVAILRRKAGIGTVWAVLSAAGLLFVWLSARSWAAQLEAGFRPVDYGPMDERWGIVSGLLAVGAMATRYALRETTSTSPTSVVGEGAREGAAGLGAFALGGMGAGAAISRPVVAMLSAYIFVATCVTVWRRRRSAAHQ